ncbi:MAG: hypothetical protein J6U87_02845 [Clostridia bacterium]|nr:hypothetical protein [Clostridia bacterium]
MSEREGRELPAAGLPDEEFADVMAGLDKAAPLLRAISGKGQEGGAGAASRHRALLCAMKPYLSPARQAAADYLLRLWQVGEFIKNMTGEG